MIKKVEFRNIFPGKTCWSIEPGPPEHHRLILKIRESGMEGCALDIKDNKFSNILPHTLVYELYWPTGVFTFGNIIEKYLKQASSFFDIVENERLYG